MGEIGVPSSHEMRAISVTLRPLKKILMLSTNSVLGAHIFGFRP